MEELELIVNGQSIPLNEFARKIVHDVVKATICALRGVNVERIRRIVIE
ncbi:MAG: hypothetical protein QXS20_08230 [Candidatus Thorarchaeota archaeon]